jgi:hypothetical protein
VTFVVRVQAVKANDLLAAPGVTNTAGLAQATSGKGVDGAAPSPPPHAASQLTKLAASAAFQRVKVFIGFPWGLNGIFRVH